MTELEKSDGYLGNQNLKKANVPVEWTPELIEEYLKCRDNPIYFIENYMRIVHVDDGLIHFNPRDYQKRLIESMTKDRFVLAVMSRQVGKALELNTPIPTPNGFVPIKDIHPGDYVIGADGQPTKVIFESPIFYDHECYRVSFSTGEEIIADADHLWTVGSRSRRRGSYETLTTKEILNRGIICDKKKNEKRFWVDTMDCAEFSPKDLQIDPYLLGYWLGDGFSSIGRITVGDGDLDSAVFQFEKSNFDFYTTKYKSTNQNATTIVFRNLTKKLKEEGVLKNKHIPVNYLFSSVEQRKSLLQGIMDSDGHCSKDGKMEITLKSKTLIDDVYQLMCSLGLKARVPFKKPVNGTDYWKITFSAFGENINPFRIPRKSERVKSAPAPLRKRSTKKREIVSIEKVESVPVKCIGVDNESKLFAAGRGFVPTHNSTAYIGFLLHYILFNEHKQVGILANKGETARELLGRIKLAYQYLPKWLQQGVTEWNKGNIVLENGCEIFAGATTSNAVRGYSFSVLVLDEVAHIEGWEEFSTSVLPTISSGKTTKMIAVSTPNGLNHFYQMVDGARKGRNSYVLHEVIWRDVPGRDEKWKRETLELMNWNYEKFAQEQENEFLGSSGTLISGSVLKELDWSEPVTKSADGISIYENPESDRNYIMTVDVARGKGIDYSAIQVTDITDMPYRQVATFHSNIVTPADLTSYIFMLGKKYNEATTLIEVNDIGAQVSEMLFYDYEYENVLMTENAGRQGKRISGGGGKSVDIGIRMTKTVKAIGCSILKMLIEQGQYVVNDWNTIHELSVFSAKGQSYEAEPGEHDDLVDPLLLFAWLSDQAYFKDLTDINTLHNLRDSLPNSDAVDMNDLPDMVMIDGVDHTTDSTGGDSSMDAFF